jgi:SAM-dependent methyltransferase
VNYASLHHGNPLAHGHGFDLVMGNVQDGDAEVSLDFANIGSKLSACRGIEVRQRFITQEHVRLTHQSAAQGDPLALAAGERHRKPLQAIGQPETRHSGAHTPLDLGTRKTAQFEPESQIVINGKVRVQCRALEHHRHPPIFRGRTVHDFAPNEDAARSGRIQPGDQSQGGGLPASRGADQGEQFSVGDDKVQIVHRRTGFTVRATKDFGQMFENDLRHGWIVPRSPLKVEPAGCQTPSRCPCWRKMTSRRMPETLKRESEKLVRSWMQHDSVWLRDYLVGDVEDPRLNLQSILTRHCLVRTLAGEQFAGLMTQEYRFAAVMNWLITLSRGIADTEELAAVRHALQCGADNAEGIEIPRFMINVFQSLPANLPPLQVPNYIDSFLTEANLPDRQARLDSPSLSVFEGLWRGALADLQTRVRPSVVEAACGSANDYRGFHRCGLAPLIDYTGFDLCPKNIQNARALFPAARFEVGNVFEIAAPDKNWDICVVHDLLEHLSLEGLLTAVREICRVTRKTLCVGFFQMDEIPQHLVRPTEEYHWNLLSRIRLQELFAAEGFRGQVVHIGSFLREVAGSAATHNPNAYAFLLCSAAARG